jgi:preprotein translocase subunit Sss1
MKCEMQNFIKFSKVSNVGQKPKRDEWKRDRKIARKNKSLNRKIAS